MKTLTTQVLDNSFPCIYFCENNQILLGMSKVLLISLSMIEISFYLVSQCALCKIQIQVLECLLFMFYFNYISTLTSLNHKAVNTKTMQSDEIIYRYLFYIKKTILVTSHIAMTSESI